MRLWKPLPESFRFHGAAAAMSPEEQRMVEAFLGCSLDGGEIVTVGPREVELEFPLTPALASVFNKHQSSRPKGCRDAHIYGLRGADGRCFYVGSTIKSLADRLRSHISATSRNRHNNQRLRRRILENPEGIEIALIDTVAETHRFEREYEVINSLLAKGVPLLNSQLAHRLWQRKALV